MNYPTFFRPQTPGGQPFPMGSNMPQQQDTAAYTQQPNTAQGQQMPLQPAAQIPQQGFSSASRVVTSRDEAAVVTADFSGALMVFPDIAHNRVYVKQWNVNSGSADFAEYVPINLVSPQPEQPRQQNALFVSLQDFQDLQDMVDTLRKEVERLKKPAGKAVKKNDANDE